MVPWQIPYPPAKPKARDMDYLATRSSKKVNTGAESVKKLFEADAIRCHCLGCRLALGKLPSRLEALTVEHMDGGY